MSLRKKYFRCARKRIRVFTRVGFYDRLTGSITYFNKNTYDLLQPVPISSTTGHKYVYQHAGEMQNSGIELQFDYTILNYKDYSLSFGFNLATLRNRVTKLQHEKKDWKRLYR